MIKTAIPIAMAALLAAACSSSGDGQTEEPATKSPSADLVSPGDPGALTLAEYGKLPGPRTRHRQPLFNAIECEAGPGENCQGRFRFQADPGFQVCWMAYDLVTQEGRSRFIASPAGFFENDPQSPDRFRAQEVLIEASGGLASGAAIRVEKGFFWLLPESSNEDDRRAAGCRLPLRG